MAIKRMRLIRRQEDHPFAPNVVFRNQIILLLPFSHGHVQFHSSLVLPV